MALALDLKPLTDEAIQEMGIDPNDLWLVKIDSVVYGPFETESLKHFVTDNEDVFETAEASRTQESEWKPFWAHTKFQRRKLQAMNQTNSEGPYWIMDQGRLKGPLSYLEIDKKIEMGLLSMTDHLSLDEGESWIKIFEIEGFDRRSHSPDELPRLPNEASFQRAQLEIVQKFDQAHMVVLDELVETVWENQQNAKVIPFKVEEISLTPTSNVEVSQALRWAIPTAVALLVTVVTTGYFMFRSPPATTDLAEMDKTSVRKQRPTMAPDRPRGLMPTPNPSYNRSPSSVGYSNQNPSYATGSSYPTHVETHQDNYIEPPEEMDQPNPEMEAPPQEHSLVDQGRPEDQNLDAAMNGVQQPETIVEEASDF